MPKIIDVVRSRKAKLKGNPAELSKTGTLAVAAIMAGVGSSDWKNYMSQFTPLDANQLKRLLGQDGTLGKVDFDRRRAYLVANGVCTMASPETQNLDLTVDTIDNGLPGPV